MANNMPDRILKHDKVRLKDRATATKYGFNEDHVFAVNSVDSVSGSPRLYVKHPDGIGLAMLWARDCVLAWTRNSKERREALGL